MRVGLHAYFRGNGCSFSSK